MKIVFLSPAFYPYRVPVFDSIHQRVGEGFTVVSLMPPVRSIDKTSMRRNWELASTMGSFPRKMIRGRYIRLRPDAQEGKATPLGLIVAPSLPIVLRALQPKVVVSVNFNLWTLISVIMGYKTVIFWEGWSHTERTVGTLRRRLRRWMAHRANSFVANGKLSKQYLVEERGVPESRVFAPGMCSTPPPSESKTMFVERSENRDCVRFLFIGRLTARKGVSNLIRATGELRRLISENLRFEVVIVGRGPERDHLLQLAQQLKIVPYVRFVDFVSPENVWEYYRDADVFVLPTLQDNWPLVVPEAMSLGLPVLLSELAGSVPDLIDETRNGYTFDPKDHLALAQLMAGYLRHPELIKQHGKRSLEIIAPYNPDEVADSYLKAIEVAMIG